MPTVLSNVPPVLPQQMKMAEPVVALRFKWFDYSPYSRFRGNMGAARAASLSLQSPDHLKRNATVAAGSAVEAAPCAPCCPDGAAGAPAGASATQQAMISAAAVVSRVYCRVGLRFVSISFPFPVSSFVVRAPAWLRRYFIAPVITPARRGYLL